MTDYPTGNWQEHQGPGWFERLAARFGFAGSADPRTVIEEALADNEGGEFSPAEQAMLRKTLNFGKLRIENTCVPRAEIVAVEDVMPMLAVLGTFSENGYSRLPVYRDSLDDPVGMVHVKDLMDWLYARVCTQREATGGRCADITLPLRETGLIRDIIFAPPSMSALDLLVRMQKRHIHLALIVDEHGGTDGLVSIEDLVERIVGNIEDEHDTEDAPLIAEEAGVLVVDARAGLGEIADKIGSPSLADNANEVLTLGGLVFTMLGRVPVNGEIVHHPAGVEFEILEADRRRVRKLKVRRAKNPTPEQSCTHAA
jgi:CBS domain containing-hemolysin-like protein